MPLPPGARRYARSRGAEAAGDGASFCSLFRNKERPGNPEPSTKHVRAIGNDLLFIYSEMEASVRGWCDVLLLSLLEPSLILVLKFSANATEGAPQVILLDTPDGAP